MAWNDVRIVGIPTPDGSNRPLGIAAVCWRICMCAVMTVMGADWADQWLPEELAGGLRGRSANDLFVDLEELINAGLRGELEVVGGQD